MRRRKWVFECHVCGSTAVACQGSYLPHGLAGSDSRNGLAFCPECSKKLGLVDEWGFRKPPLTQ